MDENVKKRNEVLAQTVINGLQSRNMSGYYAEDKEAALKQALELIDEEAQLLWAAVTVHRRLDLWRL